MILHLSDTRYTFPAYIVTVSIIVGGLQTLGNRVRGLRNAATTLITILFLAFNVAGIMAYVETFQGLV